MSIKIKQFIDTSSLSIGISVFIFIISFFGTKYYFEKDLKEEESNNYINIIYSLLIGFLFSFLSLATFKQLKKSEKDLLTDTTFPSNSRKKSYSL